MSAAGSTIIERDKEFLKFLKGRYPFYHLSNVFFRDLHYGVMAYLELQKVKCSYPAAEKVTREVVDHLEGQKILRRIDENTWLLQYPEFKAVAKKKPAAAPAKSAAARPAGAAPTARPSVAPSKPTPAPAASTPEPSTAPANADQKKEDEGAAAQTS